MKLEDLGIDSKTRHHNRQLTDAENRFLGILWIDHVGEENKISADELALQYDIVSNKLEYDSVLSVKFLKRLKDSVWLARKKRTVRHLHNHLLTQHDYTPILSKAGVGGGYWVAGSEEEAARFYDTFRQRGLTGLVKASRGKKAVMVEMMSQISFEFEDLVDKSGIGDQGKKCGAPAAIAVVDAFLKKMMQNPEKYSEDLKKIGKKFGSVLLPKSQVSAMQAKAKELQAILSELTV